jgi:hypothetical protein
VRCYYCDRQGGHDPNCPELVPENLESWQLGQSHGRGGQDPLSDSPVYVMGWLRGNVALEEAENGCDWVTYS